MSDAQTNARWQITPLNYFIQSSDWMAHDDRFAGMLLPMMAQPRRVGVSVLVAPGTTFHARCRAWVVCFGHFALGNGPNSSLFSEMVPLFEGMR